MKRGAAVSDFTRAQWESLKARYGHRCAYCGDRLHQLTQDHVIPLTRRSDHTLLNIVPACWNCNRLKGNREDFAATLRA
jgi:5-methylcytosine-specific restriction endonuclease McrA